MKKIITLLLVLAAFVNATAQDITGSWTGKLDIMGTKLNLVFNITKGSDGKIGCTLDSPDQGAKGIPAEITVTDGTAVKITIQQLAVVYEGRLADGMLKGQFTQNGFSFPLEMKPGTVKQNRPQTPQPPYPYTTEEVTFTNSDDNATLSGTMTYPTGFDKQKKGTVPVVIMVTGSGQQNRDEEIFGHKPFYVIADMFARYGVATLRYDDRGVDRSTGNAAEATTMTNMHDAMAGIDFLHKDGRFGRIGMVGHSEGGTIAFMSASEYPDNLDFIVSMAGAAVRGDSIIVSQNRAALEYAGMPQADINSYCLLLDKVLEYRVEHGSILTDGTSVIDSLAESENVSLPVPALQNLSKVLTSPSPWMDQFLSLDPQKYIPNVKCPVLAINGSLDKQVDAKTNLGAIRRLLPKNEESVIKEYPSMNHLFQHCKSGDVAEYAAIEETMSYEVREEMAFWILRLKYSDGKKY